MCAFWICAPVDGSTIEHAPPSSRHFKNGPYRLLHIALAAAGAPYRRRQKRWCTHSKQRYSDRRRHCRRSALRRQSTASAYTQQQQQMISQLGDNMHTMHQGRQSIWTTRKNGHSIATSPRSLSRECTAQCTVLCKHCRYQFEKTQHRASSVGGPFIGDSGRKVMLAEFYARRSVVRRQQTAIDKRRCVKFVTNLGKCLE